MDYYIRPAWVEVCQKFFEAYVEFRVENTEKNRIEHNCRQIEIAFFDCDCLISVEMYCPNIMRSVSGCYDGSAQNTEKLIRMILWLALDVEELEIFNIEAIESKEEYSELWDILVEKYCRCYSGRNYKCRAKK